MTLSVTRTMYMLLIPYWLFICPSGVLCCGTVLTSVWLYAYPKHLPCDNSKVLQPSDRNISLDSQGRKGQTWFLEHDSENFRATNLKLVTDTSPGSSKVPIHFGRAMLNFRSLSAKRSKVVFGTITS